MTQIDFSDYLQHFDFQERLDMKIQTKEVLERYAVGEIQLVDIRFREEHAAWRIGIGMHIPLNELPNRLNELDRSKTIVTMCPHYDRAEIARLYLTLQGFKSRYLNDGMLGIIDFLRGDKARDYMARLGGNA